MKFCCYCSGRVSQAVPPGDSFLRYICDECGVIHYQNPRMIVGSLTLWEDSILLCRRAIEPRPGLWTLPAGFLENDELVEEGAARETLEEAGARVEIQDLFTVYSIPHVGQVYLLFRARLLDLDFKPGPESLEARLFTIQEIPWQEIAFSAVTFALEKFRDEASGSVHIGSHQRRKRAKG